MGIYFTFINCAGDSNIILLAFLDLYILIRIDLFILDIYIYLFTNLLIYLFIYLFIYFAFAKESKRVSFIQERKIMFFTAVIQGFWPEIFTGSFQRTFAQNTDLKTFFCAIHLICFVRFLNEYCSTCCDCLWSSNIFYSNLRNCKNKKQQLLEQRISLLLGRLFSMFQEIKC